MSVFIAHATSLFRRSLGVPGRLKTLNVPPLYYLKPSALAILTPGIIAIDALLTANVVELTWRRWRNPPETAENGGVPALRPWWLRVAVCTMEVTVGTLLACSLLIHRSRTGALLSILPPKNPKAAPTGLNRRIFIQNAGNWRTNGTIFPLSACTLTRVEQKVLFLQVKGMYGGWKFDLNKAFVDGEPITSVETACEILATRWKEAGGQGTILTS
ncbi:hypothetical protein DFH07DRAFT_803604 [Mycena maculata]|uniref:Uncharacterized protein n=1 Tax=Mycena maculata TaxID=230809 RepID=A0AAD7JUH8_9AGAR|nr:hypothetical protein DFH07DRAFT_803604 [Mycena maculata]